MHVVPMGARMNVPGCKCWGCNPASVPTRGANAEQTGRPPAGFDTRRANVSNYVCREHHIRPTTWRGTGRPEYELDYHKIMRAWIEEHVGPIPVEADESFYDAVGEVHSIGFGDGMDSCEER